MSENGNQDTWSYTYIPVEDIPGWGYTNLDEERKERLPHMGCIRVDEVENAKHVRVMHDPRDNTCWVFVYDKLPEQQKPMYSGKFDIEVTGLALVRQQFTLDIAMPRTREEMEDISKGIVCNHEWQYQEIQDNTLKVTIVKKENL